MICLGIESTAHTFGASISELKSGSFRIRSDCKDVYKAPAGSGIHPREASRHHEETCSEVIKKALTGGKVTMDNVDFVAYAASSLTGQSASVSVPVFLGTPPTPTPRPAADGISVLGLSAFGVSSEVRL